MITLQYDGAGFSGWQVQRARRTIQGDLEKALQVLNQGRPVRVTGAGRTDAGVHATGQVAHFDLGTELDSSQLRQALNGNLKEDLQVLGCQVVPAAFHARYGAHTRHYRYRCCCDEYILERHTAWLVGGLDLKRLNRAAALVEGEHDFTSFSYRNQEREHRRCQVSCSTWNKEGKIVNYVVVANRFLHHMVRYLVGTMVEVSRGRVSLEEFQNLIENPQPAAMVYKAPPQGLILERVEYADL